MAFDISHIMQGGDFRTKSLGQLAAEAEQEARTRNKAREDEIRNIYGEMLSLYSPGGAMEKAGMQQIQRAKVGATTGTMQRDISRGLYGIRPYEAEWEATTGVGARMTLEDMLTRGRAAIMGQQASFIERIEDQYPDLGAVERGYAAQASTPGGQRTGGTGTSWTGTEPSIGGYKDWQAEPSTTDYGALNKKLSETPSVSDPINTTLAQLYTEGRAEGTETQTESLGSTEKRTYPGMYTANGVQYVGRGRQRGRVIGWKGSRPLTTPDPE